MFREEERKRLQAEEHEVQKVKDAHQNMLQQVSDSLPPEPASGSAGVFVAFMRKIIEQKNTRAAAARARQRKCVCVWALMHTTTMWA